MVGYRLLTIDQRNVASKELELRPLSVVSHNRYIELASPPRSATIVQNTTSLCNIFNQVILGKTLRLNDTTEPLDTTGLTSIFLNQSHLFKTSLRVDYGHITTKNRIWHLEALSQNRFVRVGDEISLTLSTRQIAARKCSGR